jgi:hypothetical protein
MTVAQLDKTMTAKELTEWMVYYSIEPFGGAREDYRAALVSSVLANVNGAKVTPEEFIRPWSFKEEMAARVEAESGDVFNSTQKSQMTLLRALGGGNGKVNR